MTHVFRFAAACVLLAFLSACEHMSGMSNTAAPSLTSELTKQLGVTETQAQGGVGSMLAMAKSKLGSAEFAQIGKVFPDADKYVQAAQNLNTPLTDINGVKSAFQKLGMSPEMVNQFKPVVLDYAGKVGGDQTKTLLASVL
jgi:hypothetical protein